MVIRESIFNLYDSHTELQMWQFIIDYMTGLDPRITCNTTVDAQFADSSATATFDFDIDGQYILRMYRNAVNSNAASGIYIVAVVNDIVYGPRYAHGWRYSYHYDDHKTGENYHLRMKSIVDSNYILIWVGLDWYSNTAMLAAAFPTSVSSAYLKTSDNAYCSTYDTSNLDGCYILRGTFYRCSDGATNFSVSNTLLNFNAGIGNLSYTQHCPILNNGQMEVDFTEFTSCSTITLGASIALENGNTYLAIGDHTLAPLTV